MADKNIAKGLDRFGKAIFNSGLIDFVPGGKLAENLAKVVGAFLNIGDDPETVGELIEQGVDPTQAGQIREAIAREVEAYEETKREELRTEQEAIRAVTERHAADMMSDVPLNKIIRPALTIAVTASAVYFSFLVLSIYVLSFFIPQLADRPPMADTLVLQAMMFLWGGASVSLGFYFQGRSGEKKTSINAVAEILKK